MSVSPPRAEADAEFAASKSPGGVGCYGVIIRQQPRLKHRAYSLGVSLLLRGGALGLVDCQLI